MATWLRIALAAPLLPLAFGCAGSERTAAPRAVVVTSPDRPIAPPVEGLTDEQAARAALAGITDAAPLFCHEEAIVATARVPVHAGPSANARLLGHLRQGAEVTVLDKVLWHRLPTEWSASRRGERNGLVPSWAKVEFHDGRSLRQGYIAWSALEDPSRQRDPAAVMLAAAAMAEVSAAESDAEQALAGHGHTDSDDPDHGWAEAIAAAAPACAAIDAIILAADPRAFPRREPQGEVEFDLANPTRAELFFLGRAQGAKLLALTPTISPEHPAAGLLREVGSSVAANSLLPRPYTEWIWVLVEDDAHATSFSLPGGYVFVTTGMMRMAESVDELAAVLAHEVAHVEAGHGIAATWPVVAEASLVLDGAMPAEPPAAPAHEEHGRHDAPHGHDADAPLGSDPSPAAAEAAADEPSWDMESEFEPEHAPHTGEAESEMPHSEQEPIPHDDAVVAIEAISLTADTCGGGPLSATFFHVLVLGHGDAAEAAADARAIALSAAAGYAPEALSRLLDRMLARGYLVDGFHYSPWRQSQAAAATSAFLRQGLKPMPRGEDARPSDEDLRNAVAALPLSAHGHESHEESDSEIGEIGEMGD